MFAHSSCRHKHLFAYSMQALWGWSSSYFSVNKNGGKAVGLNEASSDWEYILSDYHTDDIFSISVKKEDEQQVQKLR